MEWKIPYDWGNQLVSTKKISKTSKLSQIHRTILPLNTKLNDSSLIFVKLLRKKDSGSGLWFRPNMIGRPIARDETQHPPIVR